MKLLLQFVCLIYSSSILAFQVEPMVQKLSTTGINAQAEFRLENASDEPLAVESVVMVRKVIDGAEEELTNADQDFIVMPPQATIESGQFQLFRIRYLGSQELDETVSYRVIFKQLPLQFDASESGVEILFDFETLVFVTPQGKEPKLNTQVNDKSIELVNAGPGLVDFSNATITLATENGSTSLSWNEFGEQSPVNYLVPRQKIEIPLDANWGNGDPILNVEVQL